MVDSAAEGSVGWTSPSLFERGSSSESASRAFPGHLDTLRPPFKGQRISPVQEPRAQERTADPARFSLFPATFLCHAPFRPQGRDPDDWRPHGTSEHRQHGCLSPASNRSPARSRFACSNGGQTQGRCRMSKRKNVSRLTYWVNRYLAHRCALGPPNRGENSLLKALLRQVGKRDCRDLNARGFEAWLAGIKNLHPNTRRKYYQIARLFCLYRRRSEAEAVDQFAARQRPAAADWVKALFDLAPAGRGIARV